MNSKFKIIDAGLQMAAASAEIFPVLEKHSFIYVGNWIVFKAESAFCSELVEMVQRYLLLPDDKRKRAKDSFQDMPEMLEIIKALNCIIRVRRKLLYSLRI